MVEISDTSDDVELGCISTWHNIVYMPVSHSWAGQFNSNITGSRSGFTPDVTLSTLYIIIGCSTVSLIDPGLCLHPTEGACQLDAITPGTSNILPRLAAHCSGGLVQTSAMTCRHTESPVTILPETNRPHHQIKRCLSLCPSCSFRTSWSLSGSSPYDMKAETKICLAWGQRTEETDQRCDGAADLDKL